MKRISRADALRLIGPEGLAALAADPSGEHLVPTGAKVVLWPVGCARQYFMVGYAADGSDLTQ